jgi:hypothetical protein
VRAFPFPALPFFAHHHVARREFLSSRKSPNKSRILSRLPAGRCRY